MNDTIQRHLSSRTLEERPGHDDDIVGFWNKALEAFRDARHSGASADGRFLRAYDASRLAALAMMCDAGYRLRGAEQHHYATFDVARSLASDPDLERALKRTNALRSKRHAIQYEAEGGADEELTADTVAVAQRILDLGAKHLRTARPSLAARIGTPRQ